MDRERLIAALGAVVCAGSLLACAPPAPPALPAPPPTTTSPAVAALGPADADRGTVVSAEPIEELDVPGVTASLARTGLDTSRVRSGVRASRIVYRTLDPRGAPTTASTLLVLPDRPAATPVPQAMWLHGTTLLRSGVASQSADRPDRPTAYALAAAGYAVTAPDYLGLGEGPGSHPYVQLSSVASASVDALRAVREVVAGVPLSEEVLVTGHSQGGAATMAVGRALPEVGLTAGMLVPLSGPFDVGRLIAESVDGRIANSSLYLAYLTTAWNRLHGLWPSDGDAFRPPYDVTVPPLFDGEHPEPEVFSQVPPTPTDLFTDETLARLASPDGALRAAVDEASGGCSWRPAAPVVLFTSRGDRDVPAWNAEYCRERLAAAGGAAEIVDVGELEHSPMARAALPRVLELFDAHTRAR